MSLGFIGGCSFSDVHRYPHSWSPLPTLSNSCSEIFGQYQEADPLESGNPVPSLWAFRLNMLDSMRADDKTVKSRVIWITQEKDASIKISYLIDGKQISDRQIAPGGYICKPDGLQLTYRDDYGYLYWDLPSYGKIRVVATLWRDHQYLYVKLTSKVSGVMLYVVPSWGTNEDWYRFPTQIRESGH